MRKNKRFYHSLKHALDGFRDAFKRERNLRFHLVIGNLICVFAWFYGLNRTEWAILLVTITVVVGAELFNTAIEKAVDTATRELRTDAKHAKDIGAAATLCTAIGALLIGIALFGEFEKIGKALFVMFTNPWILGGLACLGIFDIWLLFFSAGKKRRNRR